MPSNQWQKYTSAIEELVFIILTHVACHFFNRIYTCSLFNIHIVQIQANHAQTNIHTHKQTGTSRSKVQLLTLCAMCIGNWVSYWTHSTARNAIPIFLTSFKQFSMAMASACTQGLFCRCFLSGAIQNKKYYSICAPRSIKIENWIEQKKGYHPAFTRLLGLLACAPHHFNLEEKSLHAYSTHNSNNKRLYYIA